VLISNSAASISKPARPCDCVNGGGVPKQRYITQADADDAAKVNRAIRSMAKKAVTRG
jgi:hypothetical protein